LQPEEDFLEEERAADENAVKARGECGVNPKWRDTTYLRSFLSPSLLLQLVFLPLPFASCLVALLLSSFFFFFCL